MRVSARMWIAMVFLVVVMVGTGCAVSTTQPPTGGSGGRPSDAGGSSKAPAAEAAAKVASETVGSLTPWVLTWNLGSHDFSAEPKGNLGADTTSPLPVLISTATASPASITFDVVQFYKGESANREAKKDGQQFAEDDVYERNAYKFGQTLPVTTPMIVLVQSGDPSTAKGDLPASPGGLGLSAVTYDQFCGLLISNPDQFKGATFWIQTDGKSVTGIMQVITS